MEPLFIPASFFLVRVPFLPIDIFFERQERDMQIFYENHPLFQEAIALASPLLWEAAEKKREKGTSSSLFKYFSRMTSRATPFGLFSFVACGLSAEKMQGWIDLEKVKKRARPDMEWLQTIIEKICQDEKVFLELPVQHNPLLATQGDRFFINYFVHNQDQKSASLKKNPLIEAIFCLTEKSITIKKLIEHLLVLMPSLVPEKVQEVIKKVLKEQFLWFSLTPSLISVSPFKEFLTKIPTTYGESLSLIQEKIEEYTMTAPGFGQDKLLSLGEQMKNFGTASVYLQVDTALPYSEITLAKPLLEDVAKAADILWYLGERDETNKQYFERFVNKYGMERLVPVLELLDEVRGLGEPKVSFQEQTKNDPVRNWQSQVLADCLWEHKLEITITEELIKEWKVKPELHKVPPSMDLFFELANHEPNSTCSEIIITGIALQGGSTFGRFLDMFDSKVHKKLEEFYAQEEFNNEDVTFVESSYLPPKSKGQNVAINPHFRKEIIDLSPCGYSTLSLREIYVGAKQNRLYLSSQHGNIEYYVTASNVLNALSAPVPLRFLRDVSKSKYRSCRLWDWGEFNLMPFLPRVRFNNIILSLAHWNVDLKKIGALPTDSISQIIEKFNLWGQRYEMPRYIFIREMDNKLLIDRSREEDLKIIGSYLKKKIPIVLMEKYLPHSSTFLKSSLGNHHAEYVLPLLKHARHSLKKPKKIITKRVVESIPTKLRFYLPGSEWLFVKFYLSQETEKLFLIQHLYPSLERLQTDRLINHSFFIRFSENNRPHVRVRYHGKEEMITTNLLPRIRDWSYHLIQEGIIQEMEFCSYEREVERYGGSKLIGLMEEFFCVDSQIVFEFLLKEKEIHLPLHVIAASSILDLLNGMHLTLEEQNIFFHETSIEKTALSGFKDWRKKVLFSPPLIQEILCKRQIALTKVRQAIDCFSHELTSSPFSILSSIIHMHCNRLMGTDPKAEAKARAFAGYAIKNAALLPYAKEEIKK